MPPHTEETSYSLRRVSSRFPHRAVLAGFKSESITDPILVTYALRKCHSCLPPFSSRPSLQATPFFHLFRNCSYLKSLRIAYHQFVSTMNELLFPIAPEAEPNIRLRLAQAIAWCSHRHTLHDIRNVFRSPELAPARPFVAELPLADGTYAHNYFTTQERASVVEDVARRRAKLLADRHIVVLDVPPDLAGGRLLVFDIDCSVWDGLSEGESDGFFDVNDIPAWDTWVHFQHVQGRDTLLCWVPPPLIYLADQGIAVNCTACIQWASK
jgi:hypothetical protein